MTKILVVEDDNFLANAYRVKLTKSGYEVQVASDGDEALKLLAQNTPDLIILDLVMPGKDGFAVLVELNNNDLWKDIPTIVASNLGQKEDIEKAIKSGADDYIIKTDFSMNDIIGKVVNLIGKKP